MSVHPRHDVLFEILRRQNMADRTERRLLNDAARAQADAEAAAAFQASAMASWARPLEPAPDPIPRSAPKAGRDYEFFRAVGA